MIACRSLLARGARSFCSTPSKELLYSQRMDKTGRPVSPHLMIYKLPLIAYSSVTVRITGFMAGVGFFGLSGLTVVGGSDFAMETVEKVRDVAEKPLKFAVAWVLAYQWLGSARHAYWDMTAKGFHNQTMYKGALAIFGGTTALSLALAYATLPPARSEKKETN
jgi:succinate dehydrogenase cytochrome b556 subunit